MTTVHVEHQVQDFDAWKVLFDTDPLGRQASGVRRFRILRPIDEPDHILLDLDFDTRDEAKKFLLRLRELWLQPQARATMKGPAHGWVAETVESREF
ncbi:hypothetical protein R8Z50_31655 [Longispora sp. K20-0274]|uniref:hypothetical protein n=1 Tax=Longispora sp. K20-0274 TaxID=3088255 RepID=UPI0039998077